jgi:hypothetical protein
MTDSARFRSPRYNQLKKRALEVFERHGGWLTPPEWAVLAGFLSDSGCIFLSQANPPFWASRKAQLAACRTDSLARGESGFHGYASSLEGYAFCSAPQ